MSINPWIYHHPIFECDRENPEVLIYSPWAGHRRFAYDYVRCVKPSLVVELGSYYGCSAFAFLQAVKDGALDTSFYAVDTWEGDSFTKGDYREDIYGAYKAINSSCFGQVNSFMLRETFDQAISRFEDGSIDLLHIDGSHAYEDVKRDYTLWHSKVSADGVIFFHDVGKDLLFGEPMGSHIFWEELKQDHPYTLEFPFSNGLGLLFQSRDAYQRTREMIDISVYQSYINLQDTIHKDDLRKNYFRIRDQKIHIADLERQIGVLNYHLEQYRRDTAASAAYIGQLEEARQALQEQLSAEAQSNDLQLQQLRAFARSKEEHVEALSRDLEQLSTFTREKEAYIRELEGQIADLRAFAQSKEDYAGILTRDLEQLSAFTREKEAYIRELEGQAADLKTFAQGKENYAGTLARDLEQLSMFTREKETYIRELEGQVTDLKNFAQGKENYAAQLELQLQQLNSFAQGKAEHAEALTRDLEQLSAFTREKETYIRELEGQVTDLRNFARGKEDYATQLELRLTDADARITALQTNTAVLNREKENLERLSSELIRRVQKLPFSELLLKDLM